MSCKFFKNKNRKRKSNTIVGEIPTIDFTIFYVLVPIMGVLNVQRCKKCLGIFAPLFSKKWIKKWIRSIYKVHHPLLEHLFSMVQQ